MVAPYTLGQVASLPLAVSWHEKDKEMKMHVHFLRDKLTKHATVIMSPVYLADDEILVQAMMKLELLKAEKVTLRLMKTDLQKLFDDLVIMDIE